MRTADVLLDGFGRVHGIVHRIVDGLSPDELAARVDGRANSVGWLVWHLTRIQDDHVAYAAGLDQVWLASGWRDRFALPFDPTPSPAPPPPPRKIRLSTRVASGLPPRPPTGSR